MIFNALSVSILKRLISKELSPKVPHYSAIQVFKHPCSKERLSVVILGTIGEVIGYMYSINFIIYMGSILLSAGFISFIIVLYLLSKKTNVKLSFWYMILSVSALLFASLLSAFYLPAGRHGFIALLISFPVLFIIGERVELSRFISSSIASSRFNNAFSLSVLSVMLFGLSTFLPLDGQRLILTIGFAFLLVIILLVLQVESSNLKRLISMGQPLQKYVSIHVRLAYIWSVLGAVLAIVYFSFILYFMILIYIYCWIHRNYATCACSNNISSSVKKEAHRCTSLAPLIILILGNMNRIGGDLFLLIINSDIIRLVIGLSGWLIFSQLPSICERNHIKNIRNVIFSLILDS